MPTTYAHDAFGRRVLKQLPGELRKRIHKHVSLFRIGLHGPDIVFYYGLSKNRVNQTGVRMHKEIAAPFFKKGFSVYRETHDDRLFAYLMGFVCHYMLDSSCHPYINQIEDKVSHSMIEKEMDRMLMTMDGKNPLTYFPARGILPTKENAEVIQTVFPELRAEQIETALWGMRRITSLMIYGDGKRSYVFKTLLKLLGHEHDLGDLFMNRNMCKDYHRYLAVLQKKFDQTVAEAAEMLQTLALYAEDENALLPRRLYRNYN